MKKVLLYFTHFNRMLGGSDYLPLMFIAELQREHQVTVAMDWKSDIRRASAQSGIPIDVERLQMECIKPKNHLLGLMDAILPFYRTRKLKRLARQADVCISTVNMFDFGKPAHHFIFLLRHFGDNAFNDFVNHAPRKNLLARLARWLRTALAETILRPLLGLRSTRKILADPKEHIYPNSCYVEKVMREFYGPFNSTVFYPPTIFEPHLADVERQPLRVAYIGRLLPEKRLLEIIDIVERARKLSGAGLELRIAGHLDATHYVNALRRVAAAKPWVKLDGPLYGKEKEAFLQGATYAVHAERDEAFGISVVEYLKAGLIPLVPDEGGTPEAVDDPALTFHTSEEAAKILARLLQDPEFRQEHRARCLERARRFSRESYLEAQRQLLARIMAEGDGKQENCGNGGQ